MEKTNTNKDTNTINSIYKDLEKDTKFSARKWIDMLCSDLSKLNGATEMGHFMCITGVYMWVIDYPSGKKDTSVKEIGQWFQKKFNSATDDSFDILFFDYLKTYNENIRALILMNTIVDKYDDEKREVFSNPIKLVLEEISERLEELHKDVKELLIPKDLSTK